MPGGGVTVMCHMEGSGKWPHDRMAIRHLKGAFHISLGELLNKEHGYLCRPCPAHLDVWKVHAAAPPAVIHKSPGVVTGETYVGHTSGRPPAHCARRL